MRIETQRPSNDAIRDDSDPLLVARIRDAIEAAPGRRITFARFMEMALTEPGLGYYVTSDVRPTRAGDFLTAPELHPFFGRCVGRLLSEISVRIGSPPHFVVEEWGAGRGTLERTVVDGLQRDDAPIAGRVEWRPVDVPGRHPALTGGPVLGALIANEYLDALPAHRLVQRGDHTLERYVTWAESRFTEVEDELSDPCLLSSLDASRVSLADGQLAEVRPAADAWLERAAARLEQGILLIIDYGHAASELYGPRRRAGTLVTYRDHIAGDDPFTHVGRQDITAHVDISALERVAAASGLQALGSTTQARFVAGLGLGEMLYGLGQDPATDPADYLAARASVARLLDPRHLGGFRVLAFGRGVAAEPVLPGFAGVP